MNDAVSASFKPGDHQVRARALNAKLIVVANVRVGDLAFEMPSRPEQRHIRGHNTIEPREVRESSRRTPWPCWTATSHNVRLRTIHEIAERRLWAAFLACESPA